MMDLDITTDPEAWRKAGHTCERETLDGAASCPHPSHCEHEFARHVGVKVFNRKGMAWVQLSLVVGGPDDLPEMWICTKCGEEGYEVPA